jgi:hypothetical protein
MTAYFWHASTSICGQIFMRVRIGAGSSSSSSDSVFILTEVKCFHIPSKMSLHTLPQFEDHCLREALTTHVPNVITVELVVV